ncbi:hypothetical protein [Streptomyces odontomachi]|uniref:hypothetical protein n=1 Tax=Streptomyces odontomachi TaxID=2944940 RepID=UPI00210CE509|nr:hypothetical protein [Streptomyces sp. ODS25]
MGTDVFALITDWEPMVDAFRTAGDFEFYWDANARQNDRFLAAQAAGTSFDLDAEPELLPYAREHHIFGGFGFVAVEWYFDKLRASLPPHLREPLETFVRTLYAEDPRDCDDLAADGATGRDSSVLYALRPASVRRAVERFEAVPWDELRELDRRETLPELDEERYVPCFGAFEAVLRQQRAWLGDAAECGRGVVAVISQ